jgi:hypothetical protein
MDVELLDELDEDEDELVDTDELELEDELTDDFELTDLDDETSGAGSDLIF